MKNKRLLLILAVLLIASLACSLTSGGKGGSEDVLPGDDSAPSDVSPSSGSEEEPEDFDTEFPLPTDVENFMDLGKGGINYQTTLSLDEVVSFYRDAFAEAGYDERDITTSIGDDYFSIVWDGHPSGQAIVVQGTDLGDGVLNVNVRFEDV